MAILVYTMSSLLPILSAGIAFLFIAPMANKNVPSLQITMALQLHSFKIMKWPHKHRAMNTMRLSKPE